MKIKFNKIKFNSKGSSLIEVVISMGLISLVALYVAMCVTCANASSSKYEDINNSEIDAYSTAEQDLASDTSISTNKTNTFKMISGGFVNFTSEIGCEEREYSNADVSYKIFKPVE
jgi:hypothetical protein